MAIPDLDPPTLIRSASPTPTPMSPSPTNPLKRKDRSDEKQPLPPGAVPVPQVAPGEYESGRIICEVCGTGVSIRDEETNGFTVALWEAHRMSCVPAAPPTGEPVIYTPESTAEALTHPPTKRRRAKRTEEERIEYLRADPYVGQFEAYRVLCASCDKWIRLRPNSTYCSIPWDAHRKSCLAKKINSKNVYALEERNTLFSKDSDIRKFDAERLLCNMCDKWLSVPSDDHLQAVQKWLQHRASCQRSGASSSSLHPHPEAQPPPPAHDPHMTTAASTSDRRVSFSSTASPASPRPRSGSTTQPTLHPRAAVFPPPTGGSPSSFHDLNPSNYAPAHESRRRNAEQRAATLRADRLIGEVEPNRVFCSLCQKWVQLRQDSSYCAYPWLQHRGKCLARHQRRSQKAADIAEVKARGKHALQHQHPSTSMGEEDELMSEDREGDEEGGPPGPRASEDPESEEGVESHAEEDRIRRKEGKRMEHRRSMDEHHYTRPSSSSKHHHHHPHPQHHLHPHPYHHQKSRSVPYAGASASSAGRGYAAGGIPAASSSSYRHSHRSSAPRPWNEELDAEGDVDAEGEYMDDEPPPPHTHTRAIHRGVPRRPWPIGLADLDSPSGRKQFIFGSVEYLFATTYESTDDMSISALLAYLNAAMPQDKHEDFDTSEVARAVAAMKDKGRIVFEGDILRLID
ncbi:hypothetical protein B0H34DRAFT_391322 [Crassisporium funariophilum]|nr:hypothetical protein B0H34DRAFT_391322 [Crassisporium funariophilum]